MAQGNWYQLQDDGQGNVNGANAADGVGTINYVTGDLAVTLGALPDIGVHIIVSWGTTLNYRNLVTGQDGGTGDDDTAPADGGGGVESGYECELPGSAILSTITASWGGGLTAASDVKGQITGDVTGWAIRDVRPGVNRVLVVLDLPAAEDVDFSYDEGSPVSQTIAVTPIGANITTIVPTTGIIPGTFSVSWRVQSDTEEEAKVVKYRTYNKDGAWKVRPEDSEEVPGKYKEYVLTTPDNGVGGIVFKEGDVIGSINYATGALTLTIYPDLVSRVYNAETYEWEPNTENLSLVDGQITVEFLE